MKKEKIKKEEKILKGLIWKVLGGMKEADDMELEILLRNIWDIELRVQALGQWQDWCCLLLYSWKSEWVKH